MKRDKKRKETEMGRGMERGREMEIEGERDGEVYIQYTVYIYIEREMREGYIYSIYIYRERERGM